MTLAVGILGYGATLRCAPLLEQLEADPAVSEVLLFWNSAPTDAMADARLGTARKVRVQTSASNLGSAGGYGALLRWFDHASTAPFLLLLDDDAQPAADCTAALLARARDPAFDPTRTLLMSHRRDLPEFAALRASGRLPAPPRAGSCLGLHLANLWSPPRAVASGNPPLLPCAPYGGLLVPRAALPCLGLPDQRLFLYGDDIALTLAFTRGGGAIWHVGEAVVGDSAPAWNALGGAVGNTARRMLHLDDHKAYHETRSAAYLAKRFHPGQPWVYALNRAAFLAQLTLLALRHGRWRRLGLLRRALRDGERLARVPQGAPTPAAPQPAATTPQTCPAQR